MRSAGFVSLVCLGAALASIIFVGVTGQRWPLSFAAVMIVFGILIPIGENALGRSDDRGE